MSDDRRRSLPGAIGVALAALWAAWRAYGLWWCTDDAYISFRYARNLTEGLGLVYNAGERVEGFTNPLWTLWVALGLELGFAAETWANVFGIAAYVACVVVLGRIGVRMSDGLVLLAPLAAIGAALLIALPAARAQPSPCAVSSRGKAGAWPRGRTIRTGSSQRPVSSAR